MESCYNRQPEFRKLYVYTEPRTVRTSDNIECYSEPNRYTNVVAESTQADRKLLPLGSWRSKFQGSSINVATPANLIKSDNWRPSAALPKASPNSHTKNSGVKQEVSSPTGK